MRILQVRAARGWTIEKTASAFLVDVQTLLGCELAVESLDDRAHLPVVALRRVA